jgi:hypothetical protein
MMIRGIQLRSDKPGLVCTDDFEWREPTDRERVILQPWRDAGLKL